MFTGRTHIRAFSSITSSVIALTGILSTSVFAQTSTRLSSDPHDMRDAFARHASSVNTPQAFARFVEQNEALRVRYARHFSVPQDRIVSFFRDSLVPYTLPKAESLTTYGVTKSGQIYPVNTTLPKGTKVWATREGMPVLKWNCSNPLVATLPGSNLTPPLEVANTPSPVLPQGGSPSLDFPEAFATTGTPALPPAADLVAATPTLPDANFGFAVPVTDASSASLPGLGEVVDAAGPSIKDFWPVLLIPALFAGGTGGSGEAPPVVPPVVPPVIVPETNTFGLISMGLPLLGFAGYIARRKKANA